MPSKCTLNQELTPKFWRRGTPGPSALDFALGQRALQVHDIFSNNNWWSSIKTLMAQAACRGRPNSNQVSQRCWLDLQIGDPCFWSSCSGVEHKYLPSNHRSKVASLSTMVSSAPTHATT